MNQQLIDLVLDQVIDDVYGGDLTAVEELLRAVPEDKLKGYLPEIA
jgi:hypothetical protein